MFHVFLIICNLAVFICLISIVSFYYYQVFFRLWYCGLQNILHGSAAHAFVQYSIRGLGLWSKRFERGFILHLKDIFLNLDLFYEVLDKQAIA